MVSSPSARPSTRDKFSASRVANGALHMDPRIDGRSAAARRWRDLHDDLMSAMGREPNVAERALVRRAASLAVTAERMDGDIAAGRSVDHDALVRITNALARCLSALGLASWSDAAQPEPPKPDPIVAHRKKMGWDR